MNQTRKVSNSNKQLNEQFTAALKKIKFLKNQCEFLKQNCNLTIKETKLQKTNFQLDSTESKDQQITQTDNNKKKW